MEVFSISHLLSIVILTSLLETNTKARPQKGVCIFRENHISCERHLPILEYPVNVTHLEIRGIDWLELNFDDLVTKFPLVENITVTQGRNITKLVPPPIENNIQVLILNNLRLRRIKREFFLNFAKLEELSLKYNNLKNLPKHIELPAIKTIYLSDNKWNCSLNLDWVLELNENIVKDLHNLTCHEEPHPGKPLVEIATFMREIEDECPQKCICSLPKVVREPETDVLEPIITVDCSHKGFTKFPETLPSKTKTLHLQGNDIDNVSPLRTNPLYKNILDIYLDDNKISSIEELEGTEWLTNFRVLSLQRNKLTQIPTYAIDNALQQNSNMPNAVRLRLGGNPWRCDCLFTPVFQQMLQKFAHQISDMMEIKCSYVEADENSLLPVIELSRSSVCRLPSEYSVQILDLINLILVFLIVSVLAKLAYDYYHFKRTGRLPWIVTKMP